MAPIITKPPSAPLSAYALGVLTLAFLVNFFAVKLGYSPFMYCAFRGTAWALYEPVQVWISLAGICILFLAIISGNKKLMFGGAMLAITAYFIVDAAVILFSLGKGCT